MSQSVTLDDKYVLESGRVYLTGTQALVRLPMMQRQRDLAAGLNTACYITGYRGSPLGGFDQALWQAKRFIKKNHIEFQPGKGSKFVLLQDSEYAEYQQWSQGWPRLLKVAEFEDELGISKRILTRTDAPLIIERPRRKHDPQE